MLLDILI